MQPVRPISSGLLLLACAALAGVIVLELADEVALAPGVTAAAPPAPAVEEAEAEPFEPPPPHLFAVISDRPLFTESRRPFEPAEVEPAAGPVEEPLEPLAAELVGVMLTGSQRAALILPEGGQRPLSLAEGQSIDGWRVEEVESRRALLRRGEQEQVLELRRD